jgi:hypothetical protein
MARRHKLGLLLERHCSLAGAVIAAAVCWSQWGRIPFPVSWKELLGAVFTAAATGAGFLFTAASILIAMDQRPIMKWGRETGASLLLARYLTRGIWWCLAAALLSLLMFMPDFSKPAAWQRLTCSIWIGTVAGAATAVVRVLLIFAMILQQAALEERQ